MFIVWRKRPVKGKGGGPFLTEARTPSGDRHPWKPLRCNHSGVGRVAWTPLVMTSSRPGFARDSQPRQKILQRFPTIRTCCIADSFCRAAWWFEVDLAMTGWVEAGIEPMSLLLARDKPAMMTKLREVVPRPTQSGLHEFTALKEAREKEAKEWLDDWFAENRRKTEEYQARQRAEAEQNSRRQAEDFASAFMGGFDDTSCFAVLGLRPDATAELIQARYRELAKTHHPDRGGDPAEFNRIKEARDRAMRLRAG